MYACAVEGMDREQRELFDGSLKQADDVAPRDSPAKAREQRQAQEALMAAFGKARGG